VGLPATEIAALVRSGEVTAVEVVRAHLAHIEAVDARVGAFRVVRAEAALAEAHAVDTALTRFAMPLAGVPVAIKDNVPVAGEVMTDGSPARASAAPEKKDAPVVTRLRKAGAIVIGITRVPELSLYAATDGPGTVTRNPWDTARSAAGSSGGSAAAVASGSVPLAHGNDGMGSLRLPAAACGLVTLKPGAGVVPGGIGADDWSGMAVDGVPATTVADLAVGHAVLAGEEPAVPDDPGRPLRIAVSTRSPLPGVRADAQALAAVDAVVALLVDAGHTVVRRDPPLSNAAAMGAIARWMAGAEDDAAHLGIDRRALQPRSRAHARTGRLVRRAGMVRPRTAERFRARMTEFFEDVDVLLTPVTTGPPLPARPWHERSFLANVAANMRWAP
jgi:amidase